MAVRLFYTDESYDSQKFCLSALAIRHRDWKECFELLKEHRQQLKQDYGIPLRKEIHATDFVAGRGRISDRTLNKWERSRIFYGILELASGLPGARCFNVCLDSGQSNDPQMTAWDRIINRIERTMREFDLSEGATRAELITKARQALSSEEIERLEQRLNAFKARAMIFSDEGREAEIVKTLRKMHVFNPVPSKFGAWGAGRTKNITTDRIIEDAIFKPSFKSYFIQMADCIAFALLKREVPPTPNIKRYGIHEMFNATIGRICYRKASSSDPLGIVRK